MKAKWSCKGAVHLVLDEGIVAALEELDRLVQQLARELIVRELYRLGNVSSGGAAELLGLAGSTLSNAPQIYGYRTSV